MAPLPSPAAPTPRPSLALASLALALVLPLGLVLFVLRTVVGSQPALHPASFALNLILEGGTSVVVILGIPASGIAISLGHVALGRTGETLAGRMARRIARTGLTLGYLSLGAVLAAACFTVFWLGAHHMRLVW